MSQDKKVVKKPVETNETGESKSPPPITLPAREGLSPEPTPDVTLVSPLIMPKIERDHTLAGIKDTPPPPPPDKNNEKEIIKKTPPPSSNGEATFGTLPPPKKFSEETQVQTPAGETPKDDEPTAGTQQFGTPPPAGVEKYQMTENYALQTAKDIFNGLNYFLKWDISPFMYVKYRGQFVKYYKATERIAQYDEKTKPSDIKDRLKKHNSGIRDKIAMDQEDHDLIVPPAAQWFKQTGFYLTPGIKVAVAGGQILLRKVGDVMEIKRENDEFKEELKVEISQFMDVYEQEIKPKLDELDKNTRQAKTQQQPPTKTQTKPAIKKDIK